MGRFLFVVPPLVGHVNPAVGTAAALAARGHDIAWAGRPDLVRSLAGADAVVHPCALPGDLPPRPADLKGPAAFRFLWESFLVPLAEAMAPGVRTAIGAYDPDVVVCDQQAVAGALVAESFGRTWVTSATTSAELVDPLAAMPKVAAWLDELLAGLRDRVGGAAGGADPRFSPHGVLAYTTRALLGPAELPERVWLVGPSVAARTAGGDDFPWEWLDDSALPTVLVSLGTANNDAGARFLNAAAEALGAMGDRVRAVLVDPGGLVGGGSPTTSSYARTSLNSPCWNGSTPSSVTPGTTPCARRCGTVSRWSWRRSGTTSRSWPARSWTRAPGCGCGSAARTRRGSAPPSTPCSIRRGATARPPRPSGSPSGRRAAAHPPRTTSRRWRPDPPGLPNHGSRRGHQT